MNILEKIRTVPDFPTKGILFYDITTLLKDAEALAYTLKQMAAPFKNDKIDLILAAESRGFFFGTPLALKFKAGFVPIRKKGKLPAQTISEKYNLEYGTAEIEIHKDAITNGKNVLIVDDVIATGGTMEATKNIVTKLGGNIVGFLFLLELTFLKGREKLSPYRVETLIKV